MISNLEDIEFRVGEFRLSRQDIYQDSAHVIQPVAREPYNYLTSIKDKVERFGETIRDDIIIAKTSNPQEKSRRERRQVRLSAIKGANVWPHSIVPYTIDLDTYTTAYNRWSIQHAVTAGLSYLESVSCIKFVELSRMDAATIAKIGHHHSVRVYNGPGCWSHSGCTGCYRRRRFNTSQSLSLSTDCANDEIVQHEFGHVLGLTHEHTRTDMHRHIAVNYSLVSDPTVFYRKAHPEFINNSPYDLSSIQHYQTPVLVTHNAEDMWLKAGIGKLTHYDEWSINSAYCSESCDKKYCLNDGYTTNRGGGCRCVCPKGLTGVQCEETVSEERYGCGGTVELTEASYMFTIQTPNYPDRYSTRSSCTWLIKAPAGKVIKSTVKYMDLPADIYGCKHYIEIRDKLIGQVAREKCGRCQRECFSSQSKSTSAIIIFNSLTHVNPGRGVEIQVRLQDDCSKCRGAACYNGRCYPKGGHLVCGFEQGLLGDCSDIRTHDSFQKSYEDLSWTESPWEVAERVHQTINGSGARGSAEGRFHLTSIRPRAHTRGPYEGVFRIVPYLTYPGRTRCLKFSLYLCCDKHTSLRVHQAIDGTLISTPMLTLDKPRDHWQQIQHTVAAASPSRVQKLEVVFISRHDVSSEYGNVSLAVDLIEWRYGSCELNTKY